MKVASIQIQASDIQDYAATAEKLTAIIQQVAQYHDLVLVPECAFPAYYLEKGETDLAQVLAMNQVLLDRVKEIARTTRTYIAFGFAEDDQGRLYNTALLIDPSGSELGKKRKSYLWHFDHLWFEEGEDLAIIDTDFGRVGLIVCCDARSPEIVRLAALEGADMILHLANLTATGPQMAELRNVQTAFMLSVRARENGVWLAVSDKWGVEKSSITYAGRSAIYGPDGHCHYQAAADKDEIVSLEIPTGKNGKIIRAQSLPTRRPELYGLLVQPTKTLPITNVIERPVIIEQITPYITAAAGMLSAEEYVNMIRRMSVHGSNLICMPPSHMPISSLEAAICANLSPEAMAIATYFENRRSVSYVLTHKGQAARYENAHSAGGEPFVLRTKWGNIGLMHEEEGMLPEWPRCLMLAGADCLVWPNRLSPSEATAVARTRAAENRVFVISAQAETASALAQIIDPSGNIIASTLQNQSQHACGAYACFADSRMKNIVPGTHVVNNRHPGAYARLLQS